MGSMAPPSPCLTCIALPLGDQALHRPVVLKRASTFSLVSMYSILTTLSLASHSLVLGYISQNVLKKYVLGISLYTPFYLLSNFPTFYSTLVLYTYFLTLLFLPNRQVPVCPSFCRNPTTIRYQKLTPDKLVKVISKNLLHAQGILVFISHLFMKDAIISCSPGTLVYKFRTSPYFRFYKVEVSYYTICKYSKYIYQLPISLNTLF